MKHALFYWPLLLGTLALPAQAQHPRPAALTAPVVRLYQVFDNGDLTQLGSIVSPQLVDHDPAVPNQTGLAGLRGLITTLHQGFSNIQHTLEVLEPLPHGRVLVRWKMTAMHTGTFFGVPPTGRNVTLHGHDILTVKDGRITEQWHVEELLALMNQIQTH